MAYEKRSADRAALQKLKQDIRAGKPETLYVFWGEESYLKRYYLKQLRELCGGVFPEFNTVTLNGEQVTAETLSGAVDSVPMGSERKLVVVRDYKLMQPSGDMKEYLPQLLGNLPEYICLVFYFETLEFNRGERTDRRVCSVGGRQPDPLDQKPFRGARQIHRHQGMRISDVPLRDLYG